MKHKYLKEFVLFFVICMTLNSVLGATPVTAGSTDKTLSIVTADNRPLSVDRLLYMAFKSIDYKAVLTCDTIQSGCSSANAGEKAGIISSLPDMEETYPNLRKVPVEIEQTNIYAFVRADSDIMINSWEELEGYSIGILTERQYILEKIPAGASIATKETNTLVLDGLAHGEYDVAVLTEKTHEKLSPRTDIRYAGHLDSLAEYLYLHKNYEYLIPQLTDSLNTMFADGVADQILSDIPVPEINRKKTVLHIISSNTEVTREVQVNSMLRKPFENDMSIEFYTISLNSRRFSRDPERLSYFADLLRQDCASRNIAAIIVSGDDALEFLTNYYCLYFRNVPVLFYGVSDRYKTVVEDYENYFTGIVEVIEAYETVETALALFPNTKNLYVLNDYMTEGVQYRSAVQNQLQPLADRINIEYNEDLDCTSLLAEIKELPQDSLVFIGSYFTDVNGQYYPLGEMKRLLEANCAVPVFSLHSTNVEYNAVGGKCLDYEKYGEVIADMLKNLLSGGDIADMPVISDSAGYSRWVFDKDKLDLFGISEYSLPPGVRIINQIPSVWESDPRFAITLVFLLIAGIIAAVGISIFVFSRRRRKEQLANDAKVRNVKERLERIINTAPISFMLTIDGEVVEINESMKKNTGLSIGASARTIQVDPEHRDRVVEQAVQGNAVENEIMRIRNTDGEIRRYILSATAVEYDRRQAVAIWAVDIEQSEIQNDLLRTARQSLQTVLDSLPVPVRITDSETAAILYANNACLKMFGFDSLDDMSKLSIMDVTPAVQSDGSDSNKNLEELLRSDEPMSMELEYLTAEGTIIDARGTVCRIDYNGRKSTLGIITDLAKERESQRMQKNLQTVLDMLPVAVRILDIRTKKITYANKAAADMFEIPSPDLAFGKSNYSFVAERQRDGSTSADLLENLSPTSAEPVSTELLLCKPNGKLFDAVITACLIEYNGEKSSLGVIKDMTEEKEYQRKLAGIAEKEREANQLKSRFLVNMSHEIRTPMNVIIGLTEIELHKDLPEESKDIYKKISISAKNLLAIINDILDLSKIEANKVELYEDEFELEEVLNSALLVASPRLDGKNAEFMLNQALELPRFIVGDRTRLWQILKNFLDNAAKYTDGGNIVLTVFIDNEQSDDEIITVKFIVEDTGIGMDEEQLQRIFMPYEQIYNDAQKKYTGTGLGMVISKHLCELMGGTLQVESRLGIGTIVRLSIPFKRSQNDETELQSIKSQSLAGINVLAVDDDELALDIMKRLLKNSSANCTTAQSGTEAMKIILEHRDRGEYFDIILLDYVMEGLNGLETARQINMALSRAPKLLMVTAYQKLLIKSELDENGICDVIEKPFIASHFIHKLCMVLGLESDAEKESEVFTRFRNVSVLLCEDYLLNQEVASGMLAQFRVETTVAEDGKQGVELLKSGKTFDLILMDLQMPVMNGFEATRIIRADPQFDDIPIISLTADAMKEVVKECLEIGMNDHIAKPIEFGGLHKILYKWLPESKRVPADEMSAPAIDPLNETLARFQGSQIRYEKALREFSELLPDVWQDFDGAVKDNEKTKKYIHKLKGASGTVGEKDIYKCAAEFESSLRGGEPDKALYEALVTTCGIVKKRITEQFEDTDAVPLETGTNIELTGLLSALEEALREYDPKVSSDVLKLLKEKVWPSGDKLKLSELYELTEKYEFDSALEILGDMMGERNE